MNNSRQITAKYWFAAQGKLMITAEYLVLNGATVLAIPTQKGQTLSVEYTQENNSVHWQSFDVNKKLWVDVKLSKELLKTNTTTTTPEDRITRMLSYVFSKRPDLWPQKGGLHFKCYTEFDNKWGFGSSSTLSYLMAAFAGIDPFALNDAEFGGSGYDIACAGAIGPLLYKNTSTQRIIKAVDRNLDWINDCYFIYLNEKQNSRKAIENYRKLAPKDIYIQLEKIDAITAIIQSAGQAEVISALQEHENIIANCTGQTTVAQRLFPDFNGLVKSLGAWGGDFILALPKDKSVDTKAYFNEKGFNTCFKAQEILLLNKNEKNKKLIKASHWLALLSKEQIASCKHNGFLFDHDRVKGEEQIFLLNPKQIENIDRLLLAKGYKRTQRKTKNATFAPLGMSWIK